MTHLYPNMVEPHAEDAITRLSLATLITALVNFKIFNLLDVMWGGGGGGRRGEGGSYTLYEVVTSNQKTRGLRVPRT